MSVVLFFHDLSFGYASAAGLLFEHLNAVFPPGWTGIAGFNGCGKSTLLKLAAGGDAGDGAGGPERFDLFLPPGVRCPAAGVDGTACRNGFSRL